MQLNELARVVGHGGKKVQELSLDLAEEKGCPVISYIPIEIAANFLRCQAVQSCKRTLQQRVPVALWNKLIQALINITGLSLVFRIADL